MMMDVIWKSTQNTMRVGITDTTKRIAAVDIVVDKMHFKGHTDAWCHQNCNPYKLKDLDKV